MGFSNLFGASSPATVKTPPPTVAQVQENDTQADYAQRASRKKGLLSTILTNRNRNSAPSGNDSGGNATLG